jgi:hypothetical protein
MPAAAQRSCAHLVAHKHEPAAVACDDLVNDVGSARIGSVGAVHHLRSPTSATTLAATA